MLSAYQQSVQRQATTRSLTLTGQSEQPIVRGAFMACNVVLFGAMTTIPTMLALLAAIGIVVLFLDMAGQA